VPPVASVDTRAAILDAALRCYARRGVLATTIDDVRAESGASTGSLYHFFGGKRELAAAVYADGLGRYQTAFAAELERHAGAEAGIRAAVAFHLAWCVASPDLARLLSAPRDAAAEEAVAALNREFFAAVRAWLTPHIESGAVRDAGLDVTHALWLGPSQEYLRHRLARRTPVPIPARDRTALADAAWAGLRQPDPKETRR
jgi:AcrR family transcriptional regulator